MLRRGWWLVAVLILAWPASARANSFAVRMLAMPWTVQARLQSFDASKPMCIGVQVKPLWGNGSDYTGRCRYGAPLGAMRASIFYMNRRQAVGQAKDYGLSGNLADHLQSELGTIAGLGMVAGQNRLVRSARSETRAAKTKGDSKKSSFTKRASVNCAIWGAMAGTVETLATAVFDQKPPGKDTARDMAAACALAVVSPPLNRWIKSKGFDLDQ